MIVTVKHPDGSEHTFPKGCIDAVADSIKGILTLAYYNVTYHVKFSDIASITISQEVKP